MTTPTYQEALEALDVATVCMGASTPAEMRAGMAALRRIRPILEAAAAEQRDWEAIEEWLTNHPVFGIEVHTTEEDGFCWLATDPDTYGIAGTEQHATRAEAIHAAAEWVRRQK